MRFNLNNFLLALSDTLDFVEIDILTATSNHSRRVATIALRLGEFFNLTVKEKFDLCAYSILHDNGLAQEVLLEGVKSVESGERIRQLEQYVIHCEIGEENVKHFPFLSGHRNIIKFHHEAWDASGNYGVQGEDIPLLARLIALADTVDNLYHFETDRIENRKVIVEFIKDHRGTWYSEELVDAFLRISDKTSFWLDLQTPQLYNVLDRLVPDFNADVSMDQILQISRTFMTIVDSKSKFTARHSSGLAEKVEIMAGHYGFESDRLKKIIIAASLHDLGKLAISSEILDKPGRLKDNEMEIMKSHTYYTRRALEKIDGFDEITDWAANHHEKLDGSGYPFGIPGEKLCFEERLMACLDIYQALTENRPYREGMSHEKAVEILKREANSGRIDSGMVQEINHVFRGGR